MKNTKLFKLLLCMVVLIIAIMCMGASCDTTTGQEDDAAAIQSVGDTLVNNQPVPTDIEYSLERYNLIRRAYWVSGQREKAIALTCPVVKPLGYVVLLTEGGATVARFEVDGKVTSLNSYLIPLSEYYEEDDADSSEDDNLWLIDVDGTYGENDEGIFFFTPDGKYIEWTGIYLYSDIPFTIDDPVVNYETEGE